MSTPYFSTPERIAVIDAEALNWIGTPFAPFGAVQGEHGGAACHSLVNAVLSAAGFDIGDTLPRFRTNRAAHHTDGVMIPWLQAHPLKFEQITPATVENAQPGDILVANLGGLCSHHSALVLSGGKIVQTIRETGAAFVALEDPVVPQTLKAIFRPIE